MGKPEYTLIRSKRRTISIIVKPDGSVIVRAPYFCTRREADAFVAAKTRWIENARKKIEVRLAAPSDDTVKPFSQEELAELKNTARKILVPMTEEYAKIIGVTYGRVAIRAQKTRWGSCSSKGNLNFNCLLALLPENVQRYVVVHELCHRKHMNHSAAFWSEVGKYCPTYKTDRQQLKSEGQALMRRVA